MAAAGPVAVGDLMSGAQQASSRLPMLDGWRALSILIVLAAHMLPIGPKRWALNEPFAVLGMALFFTLSGFLIVSILLRDQRVYAFLVRRVARILPLAWATIAVVFMIRGATGPEWRANLLFYANLPPFYLAVTGHFWSLCTEVQFYLTIAIAVQVIGRRALMLVPVGALAVTALRIYFDTPVSIVTWLRADEILAGGTLALIVHGSAGTAPHRWLSRMPFWVVAALFLVSSHPTFLPVNYLRPYLSAALIGITVVRPASRLSRLLSCRSGAYVAAISYALYVLHPYFMFGWLGSGQGWVKYAKRPLSFALTFAAAHVSSFRFERPINAWAHRLTAK